MSKEKVDVREITPSLIAKVLLSMASLLEVTGWVNGIARDMYGQLTTEMDLSQALYQVVHGSYGSRLGLWPATRDALLEEISNGATCLANWNDRQKDASDVIALCRHKAHSLQQQQDLQRAQQEQVAV